MKSQILSLALSSIAAMILVSVSAWARSQPTHTVTLSDLEHLRGVSDVQFSPDSHTLVYTINGDDQSVWLSNVLPGGQPHKLGPGFMPLWSPDGTRIAYYSRQSGTLQLWLFDTKTEHSRQVTNLSGGVNPDIWSRISGSVSDPYRFCWSPDGSRLVFTSQVSVREVEPTRNSLSPTLAGPLVLSSSTPPGWTLSGIFARGMEGADQKVSPLSRRTDLRFQNTLVNQLFTVDVRNNALRQLTSGVAGYFSPDWSPSGTAIVAVTNDGTSLHEIGSRTSKTNLVVINVNDEKVTSLTTGAGYRRLPRWSPSGAQIAFLGSSGLGETSLFVIPANRGAPRRLIQSLDRYVQEFSWLPDNKSLVASYRDGTTDTIVRVFVPSGNIEQIDPDTRASRGGLVASRSGTVAWVQSDPRTPGAIHLLPIGELRSQVVLDPNPQVRDWRLGEQEIARWRNGRGELMDGIVIKPVGYHPGQKYPLIVDPYGQPNAFAGYPMIANQAVASAGYLIFFPNPRAPHIWMNPFKSLSYDEAAIGPAGWNVTVDDVMSGVDELVKRGMADPHRMGLYGFSNGGGIVNYLVTRTNRFRCAVSVAGALSDWVRPSLLETQTWIRTIEGGSSLWDDPTAYVKLSAVFRTKFVQTPMLLAVGDDDGNFLLDTIEMYNGLRQNRRPVTLLRYPDQGHGFSGNAMTDFWNREMSFFDQCLK